MIFAVSAAFIGTLAFAADFPEDGAWDRYRVLLPDQPDAIATSAYASVVIGRPSEDVPYVIETAPALDNYDAEEAIEAMAVEPWHARGEGGAGVKVAVFDVQWFNAAVQTAELGDVTTHDCEAHRSCDVPMDTIRPRFSFEEGAHGVACAQVIHDIAPDADLHLVRVNGTTTFENASAWAVRNDIDVVSMSMSFFDNSFHDGTGPLNAAAGRMNDGGVLLVNSAGNYATEHWAGDFVDSDADDRMEFPWGGEYLPVYYSSGVHGVTVSWDQFSNCGDTDLDILAFDDEGTIVGRSEGKQDADGKSCAPVERVSVHCAEKGWYYLRILRKSGDRNVRVGIYGRGGTVYGATSGSLADPASYEGAFTVGAVRAGDYATNEAESFSSLGPTRAGVPKPDIAGPDGISTTVYGMRGFYGTSAATPAVAGALAVLMGAEARLTPDAAAERLMATAIGDGATWEAADGALGAGRARLPDPDAEPPGGPCGTGGGATLAPCLLWWGRHRRRGGP